MKNRRKKRNRRRNSESSDDGDRAISSEALRGVVAILCTALAGFLFLSAIGFGGALGSTLFSWLSWILGVGYILFPISLVLLAIAVFRSLERSLNVVHLGSVAVFMLSSLGLVSLMFPGRGGVLGEAVSDALVSAMSAPGTVIFLVAFLVASLIIAFDVHIGLVIGSLRELLHPAQGDEETEDGQDTEEAPIVGMPEDENEASDEDEEDSEEEPDEPPAKVSSGREQPSEALARGAEDFPILTAGGAAYVPPPASLLAKNKGKPEVGDVKANMNIIKRTLQNFGIQVEMDEVSIGPTVTRYAMKPAEGVRLSKIIALQSNLELALAASPVRIEAPIPGKSLVGIEVPNISRTTLGLSPLMADEQFSSSDKPLLVALGRSITGQPHFADLARMPHILVAGATGAGKSVAIHDFIVSLLYRCGPERLRFIMVDPKRVELTLYNSIPHLLTPVITDAKKAILALKWLAKEMERRYNILEAEACRDIFSYHENIVRPALESAKGTKGTAGEAPLPEAMPYIVLIIDELADIMSTYPRELESGIVRLAQMSRAVGIHLILSTQRPSVKVITGLIKANIPARVALQVASGIDSRTILDMGGAEKLLGGGDMLFLSGEMSKPRRIQTPFISESEVKRVVSYIAKQNSGALQDEIDFSDASRQAAGMSAIFSSTVGDDEEEDELYPDAKRTVVEAGKASTSYLQRKLGIGYARAARLMDMLEDRGVIGPADGSKPRDIIGSGDADELAKEPDDEDTEDDEEKV